MLCVHCCKFKACRPRGLCWKCYYSPARDLYCPKGNQHCAEMHLGHGQGNMMHVPLPEPTTALPGSQEKFDVLCQRARDGFALFHPEDAARE